MIPCRVPVGIAALLTLRVSPVWPVLAKAVAVIPVGDVSTRIDFGAKPLTVPSEAASSETTPSSDLISLIE